MRRRSLAIQIPTLGVLGFCAGCFSPMPGAEGAADPGAGAELFRCIEPEDSERMADQVLQLVNLEREEEGLAPVVSNPTLARVAGDYACSMIDGGFFGHRDPVSDHGPGDRAILGKYAYYAIGENLAAGQETPAEVMRVWMESSSHREIILDPKWREIGIAVRSGGDYSIYWVQEFGDPVGR